MPLDCNNIHIHEGIPDSRTCTDLRTSLGSAPSDQTPPERGLFITSLAEMRQATKLCDGRAHVEKS